MNSLFDALPSLLKLSAPLSLVDPLRVHAYLGPETVMPLASILAAIAGFFLLFWRLIVKYIKKTFRRIRGLPDEVPPEIDDNLPADEPLSTEVSSTDE